MSSATPPPASPPPGSSPLPLVLLAAGGVIVGLLLYGTLADPPSANPAPGTGDSALGRIPQRGPTRPIPKALLDRRDLRAIVPPAGGGGGTEGSAPVVVDRFRALAPAMAPLQARPDLPTQPTDGTSEADAGHVGQPTAAQGPPGTLDKEAIRTAVKAVTPDIRHCYESAIQKMKASSGKVSVSFTVVSADGGGFMRDAEIVESELGNPILDACILESLSKASFPLPGGGGQVRVTYPFRFSADAEPGKTPGP